MTTNTIITIGRQLGSGGREIGQMLAKDLGIKYYDKELLTAAAKESGMAQELFENHDEADQQFPLLSGYGYVFSGVFLGNV